MHLDIQGIDKNRLYYLLIPINDKNDKIYLPVDASAYKLRKIMTEEEVYVLIAKILLLTNKSTPIWSKSKIYYAKNTSCRISNDCKGGKFVMCSV